MLAAILILELVMFRAWLPSFSPERAGTLGGLLTARGPGTLRFVVVQVAVAFLIVSLVFGESRITSLQPLFTRLAQRGIAWTPLLAHSAMVVLFGGLSSILFGIQLSSPGAVVLAAIWVISGAIAVGLLALAFMPTAFWTLLAGSMRQMLAFAFVIGAGAYAFGRLALTAWQPLSRATMAVSYAILHPFFPALSVDPSTFTMGSPDFQVQINALCSGYEGLGLMLVFMSAWLWFHRADWRFPQALVLVPISLVAIWTLNCVRVAGLILIGITGAPDIALGGFHSQAGWVAFNALALGTCLVARRVPWLMKHGTDASSSDSRLANPTLPYLLPFLALMAGSMIAQLTSAGFEWLYALRVAFSAAVLGYFVPRYRTMDWRVDWRAIALGAGVFVIWVGLEAIVGAVPRADMPTALKQASLGWGTVWIVFRVVGSVATVPIAEELAFRGFLLRWFDSEDFESIRWHAVSWMAILFSSAAFGLLHGERWLAATVAGALYAMAYKRRGSIGDAVAAHATTNALIAAAVLAGGYWQLW